MGRLEYVIFYVTICERRLGEREAMETHNNHLKEMQAALEKNEHFLAEVKQCNCSVCISTLKGVSEIGSAAIKIAHISQGDKSLFAETDMLFHKLLEVLRGHRAFAAVLALEDVAAQYSHDILQMNKGADWEKHMPVVLLRERNDRQFAMHGDKQMNDKPINTMDLVSELETEGGKFTRVLLAVAFKDRSDFIFSGIENTQDNLAKLDALVQQGGDPIGFIGLLDDGHCLQVYTRVLPNHATYTWATPYLDKLIDAAHSNLETTYGRPISRRDGWISLKHSSQ